MVDKKKILLIKFGALGDVIRTSYALPGLWEKYGSPTIYWFTSPDSLELLRFNPYVAHILTTQQNVYRRLSETTFDLVVSLDDELEILKEMGSLRYRTLVGAFLDNGTPAYTDSSAEWFDMGLISRFGKEKADSFKKQNTREHNQILESMLGVTIERPFFFNSGTIEEAASCRFDRRYFNIGLNSGAGSRWASKQLPLGETIELVNRLISQPVDGRKVRVYLLGGEEEAARHTAIREAVKSPDLVDTGGDNTLLEFAAIIKSCDYVISSDSLALHLAIAQGVQNLSFYSPTSGAEIGTFGTGVKVTSLADDYCSYRQDADNSTITAARVLEAFLSHLAMVSR